MAMMSPSLSQLKIWYQKHTADIQSAFLHFLSFPSISTDPKYKDSVLQTAQWLASYLTGIGLNVELWQTQGHPILFASYLEPGPSFPTLLLYHHYDVQPVDPLELWNSAPFEPVIKEGQVYARGACDNKGQCFYSIQAVRAYLELAREKKLNLKIFIEGEEECGSQHAFATIIEKQAALKADYLLVIDTDLARPGVPAVTVGARGLVTFHVECVTAGVDLHSGAHGGVALNANRILAKILTSLWDGEGRVAVPGFYDAVLSLSESERAHFDLHFDAKEYATAFGVKGFCCEKGVNPAEAIALRPTIEINGMSGGYTGEGFKTVIPSRSYAKISSRLVPNQDPQQVGRAITAFLQSQCPSGVELKVHIDRGAPAFRAQLETPFLKTVMDSYTEVFQSPCQLRLSGGSIPITPALARASSAEALMMGMGLDTDDIHAPNEHFSLERFEQGVLTLGRILATL